MKEVAHSPNDPDLFGGEVADQPVALRRAISPYFADPSEPISRARCRAGRAASRLGSDRV